MRPRASRPTLGPQLADELVGESTVDWLNKWFLEVSESPAGSILLFLAVFLARLALDAYSRRKQAAASERKKHRHTARG